MMKGFFFLTGLLFCFPCYAKTVGNAHPQKKQGLVKITRDNVYVYDQGNKSTNLSTSIHGGQYHPQSLSAEGRGFNEIYPKVSYMGMVTFEWLTKVFVIGRVGLQGSAGLYFNVQGEGSFIETGDPAPDGQKIAFYFSPLRVGLVYRLEIMENQIFIPYGMVGGGGLAYMERTKKPKYGGVPLSFFGGGVAVNLSYVTPASTAVELESEYGISTLWLMAEYLQLNTHSDELNFSSRFVSFGIKADF